MTGQLPGDAPSVLENVPCALGFVDSRRQMCWIAHLFRVPLRNRHSVTWEPKLVGCARKLRKLNLQMEPVALRVVQPRSFCSDALMIRPSSLFRRRVPIYIWLPVVVACAAVGFVASTLRTYRPVPSPPHIQHADGALAPPATDVRAAVTADGQSQISRAIGPPREPTIVLPVDEMDLPTPVLADKAPEYRKETLPEVTLPPTRAATYQRAKVPRSDRPRSAGRHARRSEQNPAKAHQASTGGLKNIPVIGLLF